MNIGMVDGSTYRGVLFLITMDECRILAESKSIDGVMPDGQKFRMFCMTRKIGALVATNPIILASNVDLLHLIEYQQLRKLMTSPNLIVRRDTRHGVEWKFGFGCLDNIAMEKAEHLFAALC